MSNAAGNPGTPRTLEHLVDAVTQVASGRHRTVVGIAGSPGAGKSTVAGRLSSALGPTAVLLPMDGFHLANRQLARLGRSDRKGAPDTFDAAGFTALLARIRTSATDGPEPATVYAPEFDRRIEESIAGAIAIPPEARVVIVEGNYLLLDSHGWGRVAGMLDLTFFVSVDPALRMRRLVARHEAHGRTHAEAVAWAGGTDERNAVLIEATRPRAQFVVILD
ncbi:nucleoside/nucleotide kinase family protein [Planctomonas psychrotolerans]|uniref:nucleoside/nucleotide kinase family protein n=1 Tax=Planctomonas psychrotolerans TaxID=2528712 RepID=UPI00123A0826|nr:nucleoside/nucleotide kinase family protein [Planctomonas psychrotolerans]